MSVLLALAFAVTILPGITSPSGNIRCAAKGGHASVLHCDIRRADYAAVLQERCLNPNGEMGAGVDWHGFELTGTGSGTVSCSGGIWYTGSQRPRYVTLPYGRTRRLGVFTCTSRITGVTCTNRLGHGLFISRQRWRAW